MSYESVRVTNIKVLDNPGMFIDMFRFEITFECIGELSNDLEWRVTYVGSGDSESYDQILDSILVGPIPKGVNKFTLEAPAPDYQKLPKKDILGVTVVFISCLFESKEFLRIGYYVNNEYDDPEAIYEEKPPTPVETMKPMEVIEVDEEDDDEEEEEVDKDNDSFIDESSKIPDSVIDESSKMPDTSYRRNKIPASNGLRENAIEVNDALSAEVPIPINFDIKKVKRNVFADEPRITKTYIN